MNTQFVNFTRVKDWVFFLFTVFFAFAPVPSAALDKLVLTTGATSPWGPGDGKPGYLKLAATEAFRRIGVDIDVLYLPAERALVNVNSGIDDGDVFRIAGMEKHYPNLIMVTEPVALFEFSAFASAKREPMTLVGWESLESHLVGMMTGWKFYENNVTPKTKTTIVSSPNLLVGLLRDDKVDIVLFERWMGAYSARMAGVELQRLDPAFAKMPMYFYLHKKHAPLAPKVAQALADMKADGTLQRIHDKTLGAFEK